MAKEMYVNNGVALLLNGEVGADFAFSVENSGNVTGRVSAQIDLGVAPRPHVYQWSCEAMFQATPTQGKGIELYYATAPDGDNTQIDGDIGLVDAVLADVDMRSNLQYFGNVTSENAAASEKCVNSGEISVTTRYLTIVAYNDSGATVDASDANFRFNIQPKFSQGQ